MNISERETKCLVFFGFIVLLVYVLNCQSQDTFENMTVADIDGHKTHRNYDSGNTNTMQLEHFTDELPELTDELTNELTDELSEEEVNEPDILRKVLGDKALDKIITTEKIPEYPTRTKFDGRNRTDEGAYTSHSLATNDRGNVNTQAFNNFFNRNNELVESSIRDNDQYVPIDITSAKHAEYKGAGLHKKPSGLDLFDTEKLLPKETKNDWFEVMPDAISVKNRHLINISKPIGVNTIGTSLRNPSHDIRGTPSCPKFVISPWLQSSIEPDHNLKGLCE
jgi:hypothetical protein